MPAQGARPGPEAVGEHLLHQRLRLGQRDQALARVARRGDAELLAQPPRAPAVVGDRHDRRDVHGVLLDPAQERRQAGPAADGDDPWPSPAHALAGEVLDDAALPVARAEHDPPVEHVGGEAGDGESGDPEDRTTLHTGEEPAERQRTARLDDGVRQRDGHGEGDAERDEQHAGDAHREPALDADPGVQEQPDAPEGRIAVWRAVGAHGWGWRPGGRAGPQRNVATAKCEAPALDSGDGARQR